MDGNVGNQRIGAAAYDGENKQRWFCAAISTACTDTNAAAEYRYGGEGNRVAKVTSAGTAVYVYDAFGRLAAEYGPQAPAGPEETFYRTADHLGSTRLVTDADGEVVSRRDFFPFGQEIPASAAFNGRQNVPGYNEQSEFPQKFTAKERDTESGLDYFGARYFSASLGRFTGADNPFVDQYESDPQSWNLYVYVRNNPLIFVDPNGEDCVYTNSLGEDGTVGVERGSCSQEGGTYVEGTIVSVRRGVPTRLVERSAL